MLYTDRNISGGRKEKALNLTICLIYMPGKDYNDLSNL